MILIYLITGECVEIPEAMATEAREGLINCLDAAGEVLTSFPIEDVEAFTRNVQIAELMKAEVCQTVTVFRAGEGALGR